MADESDLVIGFRRFRFGIGLVVSLLAAACSGTERSGPTAAGMPSQPTLACRTRPEIACDFAPGPVATNLRFVAISSGDRFSCGLTAEGEAHCWGELSWNGASAPQIADAPVRIGGPPDVRLSALFAARHSMCALAQGSSSDAFCWGETSFGKLGVGTTEGALQPPTPVLGGHAFAALAAGPAHTCGVTRDGEVYCWGLNLHGGLGTGTYGLNADALTPTRIASEDRFASVTAGWEFACALTRDRREVYCWGVNSSRQAGVPPQRRCSVPSLAEDGHPCEPTPVRAAAGRSFTSIAAGFAHVCGLTSSGAVYCWGENGQRQLAAEGVSSDAPLRISSLGAAILVRSGDHHSCAVLAQGALYCWGLNVNRQLGGASLDHSQSVPQRAAPAIAVRDVAGGRDHTCALDLDGRAYCWGSNRYGQLGRL
jgi:alpha-tubulin suppressor-like RCC1 family protein